MADTRITAKNECNHCHACQQQCPFLLEHGIDLGDEKEFRELAYHCFLCGECARVCPQGINGKELALELRRTRVDSAGGTIDEKGYRFLLAEKSDFLFKNYRHSLPGRALFLGCSFPAVYPKTSKRLIDLFRNRAQIGSVYDCCGKPLSDLGMQGRAADSLLGLEKRLAEHGIKELIVACPNCYSYLTSELSIPVISIYSVLNELGLGQPVSVKGSMFPPCPDRDLMEMYTTLQPFISEEQTLDLSSPCCGYGGCAANKEPQVSRDMAQAIHQSNDGVVITYCASCSHSLARENSQNVIHCLSEIMGIQEKPSVKTSFINRAAMRFA